MCTESAKRTVSLISSNFGSNADCSVKALVNWSSARTKLGLFLFCHLVGVSYL